jgi:hypothetical protein
MDFERLYNYRFRDIDQESRSRVWAPIAEFIYGQLEQPGRVLDPAAGRHEFLNAVPARERWGVDRTSYDAASASESTTLIVADIMEADLPRDYFDGVFVSNFLEHLPSPEAIYEFLVKMRDVTRVGGMIGVMGPNIRYCAKEYWDCADHELGLTHVAVEEHLFTAGFEPERTFPRFLPYSFRGILPPSPSLTSMYLRVPPAWRLLGKQFLVIGRRT